MDSMNMIGVEEYRLVMFQPDPEAGERVCVGIAVSGDLLYNTDLSRVQSLSRNLAPEILRVYLRDIRDRITRSRGEEIEKIMRDFAPTFILSAPRNVVSPVTQSTKLMLLRRFVGAPEHRFERMRLRKEYFAKLRSFALNAPINPNDHVIENARPVDVFGTRLRGLGRVGRVALAIRRQNRVLIMDGLDLNPLRSQDLMRACTQVVHTFWQYGRAPKPYGEVLNRVAIIFNGKAHATQQAKDAHDFALDQFRKESDETIEASSPADAARLAGILS